MNLDGILYIVSLIILQVLFILKNKSKEKLNLFTTIGLSIVLIMCLNAFECYVLSFFGIANSFTNLIIINLILSIIIGILMLKDKKKNKQIMQKYEINKMDIFGTIIIFIVTVFVSLMHFGFPFNINYDSADPSCHYLTSLKFMDEEKLLSTSEDKLYGNFETRKFASYVNSGLLMRCFKGKIDYIDNYQIFIGFGIFILFLTGYLLYFVLNHFAKDEKSKVLAIIVSILCILGYPLNSLQFGFEYMSLGLVIMIAIIECIYMFSKENLKQSYFIPILFLLNFGLFCAYFMFVPFVYPAEWIYLCIYSYKKDKKIITKNNILILVVTLIIPFILGYIYHLAPSIYQIIINSNKISKGDVFKPSKSIIGGGFNTDGYIYTNLYSNFILLVPLSLYIIIRKFKENKFLSLLFIFNVIYIVMLLIGRQLDKVSYYYLSKNYFTLWIITFILNFRALMYIYEKNIQAPIIILTVYIGILILYLLIVPTVMVNEELSTRENPFTVMDIYGANANMMFEKERIELTNSEIEFIKQSLKKIDANNDCVLIANAQAKNWMYAFTGQICENDISVKYSGQTKINYLYATLPETLETAKYAIALKQVYAYKLTKFDVFDSYKIIYENDVGILAVNTNVD